MDQSLLAAASGIEANQTYLDAIGNNIANSNTTGYKEEEVQFADLLTETITSGSAPTANGLTGGTNPESIGAGVQVAGITEDETQGAIQQTGIETDVAIQGSGYLVASDQGQQFFTRDGQLSLDADGNLTTLNGALIQGWMADSSGSINTSAPTTGIQIPTNVTIPASATTEVSLGGNLPAWSGSGTPPVVSFTYNAYDSLGNQVPITFTFTGVAKTANEWTVDATVPNGSGSTADLFGSSPPTITFDPTTGEIKSITGVTANSDGSFSLPVTSMPPSPPYQFGSKATLSFDFPAPGTIGAVTQFSGNQTLSATSQNGCAAGTLESFSVGNDGIITGSFSNSQTKAIGQIALATFPNPQGLLETGNLLYEATGNSGQPNISAPGTGNAGTLLGGSLEASNVNLATELTDLIVAQSAYEANTKVVSTTTTVLQSLMQLQ